jgi:hypothetical protein
MGIVSGVGEITSALGQVEELTGRFATMRLWFRVATLRSSVLSNAPTLYYRQR